MLQIRDRRERKQIAACVCAVIMARERNIETGGASRNTCDLSCYSRGSIKLRFNRVAISPRDFDAVIIFFLSLCLTNFVMMIVLD